MTHRKPIAGRPWLALLLPVTAVGVLAGGAPAAHSQCRAKHERKIERYTKAAQDDFDLLEIKGALRKLQKALEYAVDHDCEGTLAYAKALLKKGVVHWRGEKDIGRCKVYMRKAIRANACVELDPNLPPQVQRIWKEMRRKLSHYKCRGEQTPPDRRVPDRRVPDRPPPRRAFDFGEPPTKPCEHRVVDEAIGGEAVRMLVKVKSSLEAKKVVVFYKPQGEASYKKLLLEKMENGWAWMGLIPSVDVHGKRLAYFIEVQNDAGSAICSPIRATSSQPEIIMLKPPRRGGPKGCTSELPEEVCKANPDHPCCKKDGGGGGGGKPPKIEDPKAYPRFYLNAGFALGLGYLSTSMTSDLSGASPHVAGFAVGPIGGQVEFGYFVGASHLLSLAGRFGVVTSDLSDTPVIAWQALLRYRFFVVGGGKADVFGFYAGAQIGGAVLYHSLEVGNASETDTFKHSMVQIGALLGVQIGTQKIAWYLELDPGGVFPEQSTFVLGLSTGIALRF